MGGQVDLNLNDRVLLSQLLDTSGENEGFDRKKFLVCRTLTTPTIIPAEGGEGKCLIVVGVTDPEASNKEKVQLSLKNYSSSEEDVNVEQVLPVGSYLALKNVIHKKEETLFLWDNPSEIQLLSPKDVQVIMGKGLDWSLTHPGDNPKAFWNDEAHDDTYFFSKLRECGNTLFRLGCFSDALRFYDVALQYTSNDTEESLTLSNKAAALLRLGCFTAASKEAKRVLNLDPKNTKVRDRLAQAFMSLGGCDEAITVLKDGLKLLPLLEKDDREALMGMMKVAKNRRDAHPLPSPEDCIALCRAFMSNCGHNKKEFPNKAQFTQTVKDYVGPVEVKDSSLQGRSLFATEDIKPGGVLLVNRALTFQANDKGIAMMTYRLSNMVHFDPTVGPMVYGLSAGEQLGFLSEDNPQMNLVDLTRIQGILNANPFVAQSGSFWTLPSFINHSCSEANVVVEEFQDVLIVKAVKVILKNTEILRSYVPPWLPYEEKRTLLGFTCTCRLCTWELGEKDSEVGLCREKFRLGLTEFNRHGCCGIRPQDVVALLSDLEVIKGLWKDLPLPGLIDPTALGELMDCLTGRLNNHSDKKQQQRGIKFAHDIALLRISAARHGPERLDAVVSFQGLLGKVGRKEEQLRMLKALKKGVIGWYGSEEGIRALSSCLVDCNLKRQGIDFFSL